MTVKELMEKLGALPPDAPVFFLSEDAGIEALCDPKLTELGETAPSGDVAGYLITDPATWPFGDIKPVARTFQAVVFEVKGKP